LWAKTSEQTSELQRPRPHVHAWALWSKPDMGFLLWRIRLWLMSYEYELWAYGATSTTQDCQDLKTLKFTGSQYTAWSPISNTVSTFYSCVSTFPITVSVLNVRISTFHARRRDTPVECRRLKIPKIAL
jgi:hypothetical protein